MRPARTGASALLITATLLGGCAGGPDAADTPIPTIPDASAPPVPTLGEGLSGPTPPAGTTPATASAPTAPPPPAAPAPAATPQAPPAPPAAAPAPGATSPVEVQDPVELGRSLGVGGMAELLTEDPDLAGERGPELLRDLQRIAERDRPDARQIETLFGRIPGWIEDGQLDERIGIAAQAALEQAFQQVQDEDEEEGDDDD